MTNIQKLIAIAEEENGYLGKLSASDLDAKTGNAGGKFTKYARDLDAIGNFYNGPKQGFDWCDVFVDWCFVQAFGPGAALQLIYQPNGSAGAGTGYSLGYYKANGAFYTTPQPGDQIFFGDANSTWHTGIVTGVGPGYVTTVEGNAGTPLGVHCFKYFLPNKLIKGYGRPNWGILPDSVPATVPPYQTLDAIPAWYRPSVEKLVKANIMNGTGSGLNASEDLCRIITILDRLGLINC